VRSSIARDLCRDHARRIQVGGEGSRKVRWGSPPVPAASQSAKAFPDSWRLSQTSCNRARDMRRRCRHWPVDLARSATNASKPSSDSCCEDADDRITQSAAICTLQRPRTERHELDAVTVRSGCRAHHCELDPQQSRMRSSSPCPACPVHVPVSDAVCRAALC
jgi:hypothetical protein